MVKDSPTSAFHGLNVTNISTFGITIVLLQLVSKTTSKLWTFTICILQQFVFFEVMEEPTHTLLNMSHTLMLNNLSLTVGTGIM